MSAFPGQALLPKQRWPLLRKVHDVVEQRRREGYAFRCVTTGRVSTEEQLRGGQSMSPETQRQRCEEFVEYDVGRAPGVLVRHFNEPGEEGQTFDRPALREIVAMAQRGEIDVVVSRDAERLGRNSDHGKAFVDRLLEHGVVVRLANVSGIDESSDGYQRLMQKLVEAENDNHDRSEKIATTTRRKRADGKWQGLPPFGFKRHPVNGRLRVHPEQIEIVRWLFTRALDGLPRPELVAELRERYGLRWYPNRVTDVLKNRTYIGEFSGGTPGNFLDEPVVPVVIWQAVQARFRKRKCGKADRRPYGERAREWPWVGHLLAPCGGVLSAYPSTSRNGSKIWYADCSHRPAKGNRGDACKAFRAEAVEGAMVGFLARTSLDAERVEAMRVDLRERVQKQREARQRDRAALAEKRRREEEQKRAIARKVAVLDDPDVLEALNDALRESRATLAKLDAQIADLDERIARDAAVSTEQLAEYAALLGDLPRLWCGLQTAERRELLRLLFPEGGLRLDLDGEIRTAASHPIAWVYEPFEDESVEWCALLDSNQ